MNASALAELRDIHLPPDPAMWPPAPILWFVVALAMFTATIVVWRRRRRSTWREEGCRELRRIAIAQQVHADPSRLVADLARLLRRAALARDGRDVAGLSGLAWAQYLAARAPRGCDARTWHWLALSRYQASISDVDGRILLADCRRWLRHVPP